MYVLKVGSKYVCWDSFKCEWYLGRKDTAEVYVYASPPWDSPSEAAMRALRAFPTAVQVRIDV